VRQSIPISVLPVSHVLSISCQLRLSGRQQDRVSRVAESDGRGVPGASDHQLGCDLVGQPTSRTMGVSSDSGDSVADRGLAARLSRLQGTSSCLIIGEFYLC